MAETIAHTGITLETIQAKCGYANYDAMRQTWYAVFDREQHPFPAIKTAELDRETAERYLEKLSNPYPNKSAETIQGALTLLEALRRGERVEAGKAIGNGEITQPASNFRAKPVARRTPVKVNGSEVGREVPEPTKTNATPTETAEALARAQILREKAAEERQERERHRQQEIEAQQKEERINKRLSPWVEGLTWGLNYLEMAFMVFGFWYVAGGMGIVAGLFILVLGSIILLMVQMKGGAAGYAVFAWLVVCFIGGWLIEYPAMLYAVEQGEIADYAGDTTAGITTKQYAALLAILISGSSFAGTFFRYKKSQER